MTTRCIRRDDVFEKPTWLTWCGRNLSWEEQAAVVVRGKVYDSNCPACIDAWRAAITAACVAKALE